MNNLIPIEIIENKIYLIRGKKVMLDRDLAKLYGVKTSVLNQAVKRNSERFPEDFMFSLTREEILSISQIVISSLHHGKKSLKYSKNVNVFTENGVAMLSSVLHSRQAIQINIQIMRIFTKLRVLLSKHTDLAQKISQIENKVEHHDAEISLIFKTLKKLIIPQQKPKLRIGFRPRKIDREK